MATQAEQALASETYNPSFTPEVKALYGLMISNQPSESLIDEYKEIVNAMSTQNPFEGVLRNPRACEIDQANNDIGEIIKDLESTDPQISQALLEIQKQLDEYRAHTDRLIANLPTISSIVQNEIGNNTGTGNSNQQVSGNPCVGFADIMGSVLDSGQDIVNDILSEVANVKNQVGQPTDLVETAVSQLQAKIATAMTKLQEEVEKLAKSMINMNKMNLAQLLKFQNSDPCLKQIMSGVLTGSAQNVLKDSE